MKTDLEKVAAIIDRYDRHCDGLVSILHEVQHEFHFLPEDAVRMVAEFLGLPLVQVYGVATFFKAFSLQPRGEHTISVCMGTACHVRGAPNVLNEIKRHLGIEPGENSPDMKFRLETVNCLGACALGPIVVIDSEYEGEVNSGKVKKLLDKHKAAVMEKVHA